MDGAAAYEGSSHSYVNRPVVKSDEIEFERLSDTPTIDHKQFGRAMYLLSTMGDKAPRSSIIHTFIRKLDKSSLIRVKWAFGDGKFDGGGLQRGLNHEIVERISAGLKQVETEVVDLPESKLNQDGDIGSPTADELDVGCFDAEQSEGEGMLSGGQNLMDENERPSTHKLGESQLQFGRDPKANIIVILEYLKQNILVGTQTFQGSKLIAYLTPDEVERLGDHLLSEGRNTGSGFIVEKSVTGSGEILKVKSSLGSAEKRVLDCVEGKGLDTLFRDRFALTDIIHHEMKQCGLRR